MAGSLVVDTLNGVDIASSPVLNETQLKAKLNASGEAPIYACRAWVNFNGTGTVAIRASGNVSSITDNGVGDYTVNFTTAMPDINYSVGGTSNIDATYKGFFSPKTLSTSNVNITCSGTVNNGGYFYPSASTFQNIDHDRVSVQIFR